MQKITTNQYILIAVFCILTSKLMTMPAVIFEYAGKDAIFSVLFNVILDVVLVCLITTVIKKNPNTTLFSLLEQKFKRFGAIIILSLITVFLAFKGVFLLQETISFFSLALYEEINMWILIVPAVLTIMYISFKGLSAIGRSIDIYWFFVFLAVLIVLVISIMKVDFFANLPYFEKGFSPALNGVLHSLLYTGNGVLLLFFIGKVDLKPKIQRYTIIFSITMGALVVLNNLVFFNLFTSFVPYCTFALSHLSQFNPFVTELGHVGWLSIIESTINLVFMASICCYAVSQFFQYAFKIKKKLIATCTTGVLFLGTMFLFNFNLYFMLNFTKNYGFYYNAFLFPFVMLLCIVLGTNLKSNQNSEVKNENS